MSQDLGFMDAGLNEYGDDDYEFEFGEPDMDDKGFREDLEWLQQSSEIEFDEWVERMMAPFEEGLDD